MHVSAGSMHALRHVTTTKRGPSTFVHLWGPRASESLGTVWGDAICHPVSMFVIYHCPVDVCSICHDILSELLSAPFWSLRFQKIGFHFLIRCVENHGTRVRSMAPNISSVMSLESPSPPSHSHSIILSSVSHFQCT